MDTLSISRSDPLTPEFLNSFSIQIFEPFSDFLQGSEAEKNFSISLLDVVRFSGHACLAVTGAFLVARAAIKSLFPETGICIRGNVQIDLAGLATSGATGPVANVFGFITGAWAQSGFGGLQGRFARRDLLRFGSANAPTRGYRFTRLDTGQSIVVSYHPDRINMEVDPTWDFQTKWRHNVRSILENSEAEIGRAHV